MIRSLIFMLCASYIQSSPLDVGKYRLLQYARPLGRRIGKKLGHRLFRTRHGFKLHLDLTDWIPQDIYLTGEFEPRQTSLACQLLRQGDFAIDVGANIGYFSLLFATLVGSNGRVFAFEPVPALYAKLRSNLALNGFEHVETHAVALADRSGRAQIYAGPARNSGLSSLRESTNSGSAFEVELSSFDDLYTDCPQIGLVKIDVEGAELKVLRGMKKMLERDHPHILVEITEPFLRELGDSAASLLNFLRDLGYACFVIRESSLEIVRDTSQMPKEQWNAIFSTASLPGCRSMESEKVGAS